MVSSGNKNILSGTSTFSYDYVPVFELKLCPHISQIKEYIEEITQEKYEYCFINFYKNGKEYIGYHSDKEADKSYVISISLGATRKFRFRKKGDKKGYEYEFDMQSGDVLWMLGPNKNNNYISCQDIYNHSVPVQKKINRPRINITF